jgi:hypothetical protein
MLVQPFARKNRKVGTENDHTKSYADAKAHPDFARHTVYRIVIAAKLSPEVPDYSEVNQHDDALQQYNPLAVIGQERHLSLQQNE